MDALASLLNDVRADGALFGQSVMRPPWSVRFTEGAALTMLVMVQGQAWVHPDPTVHDVGDGDTADPVRIRVGDVAIVVGEAPFSIADSPERSLPARYTVREPGQCVRDDGTVVQAALKLGVRTCDEPDDGSAVVLTGSYHVKGSVSQRLLGALPRLVVVPDDGEMCPLMDVTFAEIGRDKPGQQAVLDRLLDLLLLTTLQSGSTAPRPTHRPGTERSATRSWARRCGSSTMPPSGRGPSPRWPTRWPSPAPRWLDASPSSWVSPRCST